MDCIVIHRESRKWKISDQYFITIHDQYNSYNLKQSLYDSVLGKMILMYSKLEESKFGENRGYLDYSQIKGTCTSKRWVFSEKLGQAFLMSVVGKSTCSAFKQGCTYPTMVGMLSDISNRWIIS